MAQRELILTPMVFQDLDPKQLDALHLAALDTFYVVRQSDLDPKTVDLLQRNPRSAALCSAAEYVRAAQNPNLQRRNIMVLNTGDERNEPLRKHIGNSGVMQIIGVTSPPLMRAMLGSALEFMVGRGHRGLLARVANSRGIDSQAFTLRTSSDRAQAQAFAASFVRGVYDSCSFLSPQPSGTPDALWPWPGSSFVNKAISDILDELMMNAIWDAKPEFRHLSRTETCVLEEGRHVNVECLSDGVTIAVAVEDCEGTFPWSALAGPFSYVLGLKPELKVNEGPGGAGLGLFMILQRTSFLSVEVSKGRFTRVTAFFRIDDSVREMQSRPKSILVYSSDLDGYPAPHSLEPSAAS
jgi:hypothetical protein